MVSFTDLCSVDLVVHIVAEHGASIGLKLLRTGALTRGSFSAEHLCNMAQAAARPTKGPFQMEQAAQSSWAELRLLGMPQDCADEVLAQLLPWTCAASLLPVAASRNFFSTSALLVERGGDLHHVEVRHGRRRGLVDIAARAACLDGDWRLVLWLLGSGAKAETPQGLLYLSLRHGKVALARELVRLGVRSDTSGLDSLLCDVCMHGATEAAAFLIEELGVSVNAQTTRNGDKCTDCALAYQSWETAEWLVAKKGGVPAKLDAAIGHLFDAAGDPRAVRVFRAMHASGCLSLRDLLEASSQRGDIRLCRDLLTVPGTVQQAALACATMHAGTPMVGAAIAAQATPRRTSTVARCILPTAVGVTPGMSPRLRAGPSHGPQQQQQQQQHRHRHRQQQRQQPQRPTPRHHQRQDRKHAGRRSGTVAGTCPQRVGSSVTHPWQLQKGCNQASTRCPPVATNRGGLAQKSAAEALGLLLPEGAGQEVEQPTYRAGYGRPGCLTCR
mmetsp:Transcript_90143/g.179322  ORF Transcript_90143/g.179322 Transcript_90143/m.179322 type:complete len:500 (+) Transcript_90143:83-1582(+)